jgi:creatinine amidohydrolase
MSEIRYADLTSADLRTAFAGGASVLLPVGSVEQHGPHLPVGTDTLIAHQLAIAVADRLADRCIVLPPLWYGDSPHHMSFAGTITLRADTYLRIISEITGSLYQHGLQSLVILNGHGGNIGPLRTVVTDLAREHGRSPRVVTYWDVIDGEIAEFFDQPELACGHACALETSLALHLFPRLVRTDQIPKQRSGERGPHMFGRKAVVEGLDFGVYSTNGVIGDPSQATAERGKRLFERLVHNLEEVLRPYVDPKAETV